MESTTRQNNQSSYKKLQTPQNRDNLSFSTGQFTGDKEITSETKSPKWLVFFSSRVQWEVPGGSERPWGRGIDGYDSGAGS